MCAGQPIGGHQGRRKAEGSEAGKDAGQACTRQPAQTAGPRQSRLLLRIPHPKATPECTTLWVWGWR